RAAQAALPGASASAHEVAEDIFEDVGHRRAEFRPEATRPAPATILEGGMAESIRGRALLRVLQRVVRFVYFLELVLRLGVPGIAVRMELHGKLTVGPLQGSLVGALWNPQHFIKIAFRQSASSPVTVTLPRPSTRPR